MSPLAVGLVLAAAVTHALWNWLVHAVEDRVATLAFAGFAGALVLSPALVVCPPTRWPVAVLPLAAGSGLVEAVYCGLLAAAYARGSLAVTYPVGRGTAPLLVTLGAALALGQRPGVLAVVGALCLAAGLVLVAGVARDLGQRTSTVWAVGVGTAIATYSVIDAGAVRRLADADVGPAAAAGYLAATLFLQGLFLLAAAWVRGGSRWVRDGWSAARGAGALVGLGVVAAYLLVLLAFQRADAGRVATLRESSVLLAVALARGARPMTVWVGAAFVVLGAVLVAV